MEALNFIKIYHKTFINNINNSLFDNEYKNYWFYKNLLKIKKYKKQSLILFLILDNNKLIIHDIIQNKQIILNNCECYYFNISSLPNLLKWGKNKDNNKIFDWADIDNLCFNNISYKCSYFYENNKCQININSDLYLYYPYIYFYISPNNQINHLIINNDVSYTNGETKYILSKLYIDNIPSLKKINCLNCKIKNYSNNINEAEISDLFDCNNLKSLILNNSIIESDDYTNKDFRKIKITKILSKYPNLKKLIINKKSIIIDCSFNLNKFKIIFDKDFHDNYNYLKFENDNYLINCKKIILKKYNDNEKEEIKLINKNISCYDFIKYCKKIFFI